MTTDAVGGVWSYALELARGLSDHGFQIVLAVMGPRPNSEQLRQASEVVNLELAHGDFKLEWMEDPWDDVRRAGEWLQYLQSRFEPSIVHLNGYVHAALNWACPVVCVAHSCVLSWWKAVRGERAPVRWNLYREKVERGLQQSDAVIAPTLAMLDSLNEHYNWNGPSRVIHNGLRAVCRYRRKARCILTAARLSDDAKNISLLCAASSQLTWPVYAAGAIDGCGFSSHRRHMVNLLGWLNESQLAEWYEKAAIYAAPAKYEPFGLSILAAASSGCALVLGDIKSLRELWQDAAIFVPTNDHDRLAEEVNRLIKNTHDRVTMAGRASDRATHYSADKMTTAYVSLYRDLL